MDRKIPIRAGERYGNYTVLNEETPVRYDDVNVRHFRCRCDCGNERIVSMTNLRTGNAERCAECKAGFQKQVRDLQTAIEIVQHFRQRPRIRHQKIADKFGISISVVRSIGYGIGWPEATAYLDNDG